MCAVISGRYVFQCAPQCQVVRFGFDVCGVASVAVGTDRVEGACELGLQYAATPPLLSPQFPDVVDLGQGPADRALEIRRADSPLLIFGFGLNPGFVAALGLLEALSVKRGECGLLSAHRPAVAGVHVGQCLPGPSNQIRCCQLRPDLSIARGRMSVAKDDVLEILVAERTQWQSPLSAIGLLFPGRIRADPRAAGRLHHSPAPFRSILFDDQVPLAVFRVRLLVCWHRLAWSHLKMQLLQSPMGPVCGCPGGPPGRPVSAVAVAELPMAGCTIAPTPPALCASGPTEGPTPLLASGANGPVRPAFEGVSWVQIASIVRGDSITRSRRLGRNGRAEAG